MRSKRAEFQAGFWDAYTFAWSPRRSLRCGKLYHVGAWLGRLQREEDEAA